MKSIISIVTLFVILATAKPSQCQYDSVAIAILDSMSIEISRLGSCSFNFTTEYDIPNDEYGNITHAEAGTVYLKAPDKIYIDKKGDKGHKEFFYNGTSFTLYSYERNQYATVPASVTIIELIDSLSNLAGVDFPGADVLYPDFVDDLLENSNNLIYLGLTFDEGQECYHVAGAQDDMTYQLWITSTEISLPTKMSIEYITKPGSPKYTIRYRDWKLDEYIDDTRFEFKVPIGANQVKISR